MACLLCLLCLLCCVLVGCDLAFVPPGASEEEEEEQELFGVSWEFEASPRLHGRRTETINTVNDWHYAMMNDEQRNEAFYAALQEVITPESIVLDIGAGSGLLSLMAAQLGARSVLAVEANQDIASLAEKVVHKNRAGDRIKVVHAMSTKLRLSDDAEEPHQKKANVLVSEIIGTLLLGESQLFYTEDARRRLLTADATILPAAGTQYLMLIQSHALANLTSVRSWRNFDLTPFNEWVDTDSLMKTKQLGIRLGDLEWTPMTKPVAVLDVNFYADTMKDVWPAVDNPKTFRLTAKRDGVVHAAVAFFDLFVDQARTHIVSTNPAHTSRNRDMAWGQELQMVEDFRQVEAEMEKLGEHKMPQQPHPIVVSKGDVLEVTAFYGDGGLAMQVCVSYLAAWSCAVLCNCTRVLILLSLTRHSRACVWFAFSVPCQQYWARSRRNEHRAVKQVAETCSSARQCANRDT